jgi:hypothetical protein
MPRPTRHATPICLAPTVPAALGIGLGFVTDEVLWPICFLFPAVAYEAYRTEGPSTRWASWTMAALMVALIALVAFGVDYDLRSLFGADITYVGGKEIPLGDVKVVFPAATAILAVVLWGRTRGIYTRWLAAIIFVTAAVIVFLRAPADLTDMLHSTVG